tara:strand:+ start:8751 stop:9182 length:432 start_codon:yes stop_codon:yes gene_type:complete
MVKILEAESIVASRPDRLKEPTQDERPEPRDYSYRDDGCEISAKCLECPLPKCRHDDPIFYNVYSNIAKHGFLIFDLMYSQASVKSLSKQYNITERQIFRIRKRLTDNEINFDYLEIFVNARKEAIKKGLLHPNASSKKRPSN